MSALTAWREQSEALAKKHPIVYSQWKRDKGLKENSKRLPPMHYWRAKVDDAPPYKKRVISEEAKQKAKTKRREGMIDLNRKVFGYPNDMPNKDIEKNILFGKMATYSHPHYLDHMPGVNKKYLDHVPDEHVSNYRAIMKQREQMRKNSRLVGAAKKIRSDNNYTL